MAVENFTKMVRERIELVGNSRLSQALSVEESGCKTCIQDLLVIENSQNLLLSKFFMYNRIRTSSQCDLELLRDQMISFINKSVALDSDLHIAYQFNGLFKYDVPNGYATSFGSIAKPTFRYQQR